MSRFEGQNAPIPSRAPRLQAENNSFVGFFLRPAAGPQAIAGERQRGHETKGKLELIPIPF